MSKQVYDFYRGRIQACPCYGFKSGEELLKVVHSCAYFSANSGELTPVEFRSIINLCQQAHIKMMEDNYNEGWNQNPER